MSAVGRGLFASDGKAMVSGVSCINGGAFSKLCQLEPWNFHKINKFPVYIAPTQMSLARIKKFLPQNGQGEGVRWRTMRMRPGYTIRKLCITVNELRSFSCLHQPLTRTKHRFSPSANKARKILRHQKISPNSKFPPFIRGFARSLTLESLINYTHQDPVLVGFMQ